MSFSQNVSSVKDTVYVLVCKGTLENEQPIVSYVVIKELSSLSPLSTLGNQDSFMCSLFNHSILFEEPVFTLSKNQRLYQFPNTKKSDTFLRGLAKKIDKLNTLYSSLATRKFNNGKSIEIACVQMVGEFWIITKKPEELNSYNHSFHINKDCYNKGYIYNLKDIGQSCKLSSDDIKVLKKFIE
jgi:hypothetical protein